MSSREWEPQDEMFSDSWDRLGWVERQAERIRALCEPFDGLPEHASLTVAISEHEPAEGRLEFTVDVLDAPELPTDVNFLVGNVVTDARSCLDMAIEAIWTHYGLARSGVKVQFPLEDDFETRRTGRQLAAFLGRLDEKFVQVVERAQPDYADGLLDLPMNLSALVIRDLSNANKHRNITPVVLRTVLSMTGSDEPGLHLNLADDSSSDVPPLQFALTFDTSQHSPQEARGYVSGLETSSVGPLHVNVSQKLVIDRQDISLIPPRLDGDEVAWPVQLSDLLSKIPEYVRLTLRNLNRAHRSIQSADDNLLLLDMNGLL